MRAKELRAKARENLAGNWGLSVGVALIAGLLGGAANSVTSGFSIQIDAELLPELPPVVLQVLVAYFGFTAIRSLIIFIIGGTIQLGYTRYLLKQYGKVRSLGLNDLFSQFHRFGQGFAQAFLRNLYTFLWTLLFIIPGIVKSYAYAMTPFIMAENPDMSASEAIRISKRIMKGNKGRLFCLDLSFFGWGLLCALTLGIGTLFLNPYTNASRAAFYRSLNYED